MALGLVEGMLFVFQGPVVQGLLAEAAPERARGRVQGIAGVGGSIGGAVASCAALWLYHQSHELPFVLTGVVMITGSSLAAAGAAAFARRRGLQPDEERALRTA
jgi:MprA protease rhombosortase-interaction domain-containing protein